ncbi:MAG: ATP phosphoribosyltransferase [bacterium]
MPLCIGLPKGSLQDATLALFKNAGFNITLSSRSYKPSVDTNDFEVRLLRAQEIASYVEQGFLDAGITGRDWVAESNAKVHVACDLPFSKASSAPARWVLVVPENSPIKKPSQLKGKRIATEAVNLTKQYLRRHGIKAQVEFSWGATEVKVPELVDAIVDITETGSSLRANNLRILDTLMESYPQFVVNRTAWKDATARKRIERIVLLIQAALAARGKVGLKLNLREKDLSKILKALPALRNPTISSLSLKGWIAVETIIDETVVRDIIPHLKQLGAEGIIEYPLNKVVY